jgi:hypothetical protein
MTPLRCPRAHDVLYKCSYFQNIISKKKFIIIIIKKNRRKYEMNSKLKLLSQLSTLLDGCAYG